MLWNIIKYGWRSYFLPTYFETAPSRSTECAAINHKRHQQSVLKTYSTPRQTQVEFCVKYEEQKRYFSLKPSGSMIVA